MLPEDPPKIDHLPQLVEIELRITLNEFSRELPGTWKDDELWASAIRRVEQSIIYQLGGKVSINTLVIGKRAGTDTNRYSIFVRTGWGYRRMPY